MNTDQEKYRQWKQHTTAQSQSSALWEVENEVLQQSQRPRRREERLREKSISTTDQPIELPPSAAMLQMIQWFWVSRALYVAAELGVSDLLLDGPKHSEELAEATRTHAPSLYRVLRALGSVGVFAEDDERRFTLTPLGETLCTDVPESLRHFAIEVLGQNHYNAWDRVMYSVRTGATAFDHVYGVTKWQFHAEHAEDARIFDEAMVSFNAVVAKAVVASYDFSSDDKVVDVGGGDGSLLSVILQANPRLRGVLVDLRHVTDSARRRFKKNGLAERCEVVPGDFFAPLPEGDSYILKWIIHDWDDQWSEAILSNCCAAMANGGRVLIIESVLRPGGATSFSKFMDLNMLVMTGGRERTEAEYRAILGRAGLKLTRIIPTSTEISVIEAVRE